MSEDTDSAGTNWRITYSTIPRLLAQHARWDIRLDGSSGTWSVYPEYAQSGCGAKSTDLAAALRLALMRVDAQKMGASHTMVRSLKCPQGLAE